jgi:hypothetical protein
MTKEEVNDKLYDYVEVKNIKDVKLNTHVRYFVFKEDKKTNNIKKLFRLGGYLVNKETADKYVVLSNGKNTWSVQTDKTIFYRKLDSQEIMDKYDGQLEELENKLIKYKKELGRLRKILDDNKIKY